MNNSPYRYILTGMVTAIALVKLPWLLSVAPGNPAILTGIICFLGAAICWLVCDMYFITKRLHPGLRLLPPGFGTGG